LEQECKYMEKMQDEMISKISDHENATEEELAKLENKKQPNHVVIGEVDQSRRFSDMFLTH